MALESRIAKYLADNILQLRDRKGLSQLKLAQLAEIPRSTLANIESGSSNPSLQNLARISGALQVSIEELLSRPRNECELLSDAQVPMQTRAAGKVRIYKLVPDKVKGLDVDRVEIVAGATMPGHPHLSGAKEYLSVIRGELTVFVAGEQFKVPRGAVLAFPGDQPHSYRNTGSSTAIAISIVVPVIL